MGDIQNYRNVMGGISHAARENQGCKKPRFLKFFFRFLGFLGFLGFFGKDR